MKSDVVSEITEENKPFDLDILSEEIGLIELKVNSPIYKYKNNSHQCGLKKINICYGNKVGY